MFGLACSFAVSPPKKKQVKVSQLSVKENRGKSVHKKYKQFSKAHQVV